MRLFAIFTLCIFILFSNCLCTKVQDIAEKKIGEETQYNQTKYKNELEEIKKSLKGDIKIKLKKDAKGGYSWEITGKDAHEVLKANDTLRKRLSD